MIKYIKGEKMLKKLKNNKLEVLELAIIFIITLILNITCTHITNDEIWNYGFSYNLAPGLIPYKDFNIIQAPLVPMIIILLLANSLKNWRLLVAPTFFSTVFYIN